MADAKTIDFIEKMEPVTTKTDLNRTLETLVERVNLMVEFCNDQMLVNSAFLDNVRAVKDYIDSNEEQLKKMNETLEKVETSK